MPALVIKRGSNVGATFRLGERPITIGRDTGNLIQIVDDLVSRRHAQVRHENRVWTLVDLGSRNGVQVNGRPVTRAQLRVGDVVRVGDAVLEVIADTGGPDATGGTRKVVDAAMVAKQTRALGSAPTVQETIASGAAVDSDQVMRSYELNVAKFLYDLGRGVVERKAAAVLHQLAVDGIGRTLLPDRCFLFGLDAEGKPAAAAMYAAPNLAIGRRFAPYHLEGLHRAMTDRTAQLSNDLPAAAGDADPLGTFVAVPVEGMNRKLVGAVYIDSFAQSPQAYLPEDVVLLESVGRTIAATL